MNRKFTCNPKYINTGEETSCPHCFQIFSRKDSLKRHLAKNRCPKKIFEKKNIVDEIHDHQCEYCSKIFKNNRNLKRHVEKYCKTKNILVNQQNNSGNNIQNQSHNTNQSYNTNNTNNSHNTQNINSNNVTQHITINKYGSENLDYIDDNFFKYLINQRLGLFWQSHTIKPELFKGSMWFIYPTSKLLCKFI